MITQNDNTHYHKVHAYADEYLELMLMLAPLPLWLPLSNWGKMSLTALLPILTYCELSNANGQQQSMGRGVHH